MAENTNLVNQVLKKNDKGEPEGPYNFGTDFNNVIDTRIGKSGYTLAQFFDNYEAFMKNTTFVYSGENNPKNTHIGIWIDTSVTNADQIGQVAQINN